MFGGTVRKARNTAVDAVSPFIRTLMITGRLPPGFWQDAYVLGFLNGCIGLFAAYGAKGNITDDDLAKVMVQALRQISGDQTNAVVDRAANLHRQRDKDFFDGMAKAKKCVLFSFEPEAYVDDVDVHRARSMVRSFAPVLSGLVQGSENAQIGGALLELLFFQVVKRRCAAPSW